MDSLAESCNSSTGKGHRGILKPARLRVPCHLALTKPEACRISQMPHPDKMSRKLYYVVRPRPIYTTMSWRLLNATRMMKVI